MKNPNATLITTRLVAISLALGMAWTASTVHAETLVIPLGHQATDRVQQMPQRGLLKNAVAQRYGEPARRHAPVGQPPITRWDYADFSVYFEYDHVIDSVRHRTARGTPAP